MFIVEIDGIEVKRGTLIECHSFMANYNGPGKEWELKAIKQVDTLVGSVNSQLGKVTKPEDSQWA